MKKHRGLLLIQLFIFLIAVVTLCRKEEAINRFPLAGQYNINGEQLTLTFMVAGAISLIVCREGTIVAEEYTNYRSYGADSIKNIMSGSLLKRSFLLSTERIKFLPQITKMNTEKPQKPAKICEISEK